MELSIIFSVIGNFKVFKKLPPKLGPLTIIKLTFGKGRHTYMQLECKYFVSKRPEHINFTFVPNYYGNALTKQDSD